MSAVTQSLRSHSRSPAIIIPCHGHKPRTFLDIAQDVNNCQHKLAALGITVGSAVSIALPNSYEFLIAFLAVISQRAIAAPLNPTYQQAEFDFYIKNISSKLVIVPGESYEETSPVLRAAKKHGAAIAGCVWNDGEVRLDFVYVGRLHGLESENILKAQDEDVALVLHTSGTTGKPKAVPLTHMNLNYSIKNITRTYNLTPEDRGLLVMPLFHVHGLLAGLLAPLYSGGSIILPSKFSASDFWRNFIDYQANWYTAVPTIHQILLKSPRPKALPYIRFIRSCSSPLPPKVYYELEEAFDAPVVEAYAMTEAAHQMTSNPLPPAQRKAGSVGLGQGVEIRILDNKGQELEVGAIGEICVRGENVTKGYMNNSEANKSSFTADEYFRTGDQGRKDTQGYVFITGRIKELINKGGEKISPIELDNVYSQHPNVNEAVSFAIADEIYGQNIGVAIVAKEGKSIAEEEFYEWLKGRVAKYKMPKQVFFTAVMPKTSTGKVQRRMVAEAMQHRNIVKARI